MLVHCNPNIWCLDPEINWAITEIRCTPTEEDIGIPKILPTFFGNFKKYI